MWWLYVLAPPRLTDKARRGSQTCIFLSTRSWRYAQHSHHLRATVWALPAPTQPRMSFITISRRYSRKNEIPVQSLENLSEIISLVRNQCNWAHIPSPYFSNIREIATCVSRHCPSACHNTTAIFRSQESMVQVLWAALPYSAGLAYVFVDSWQVGWPGFHRDDRALLHSSLTFQGAGLWGLHCEESRGREWAEACKTSVDLKLRTGMPSLPPCSVG